LNNSVLVTGAGSTWNAHGNLWVGDAGSGTLTVANGGSAVAGAIIVASSGGSSGTLNIGSLGGSNTAGTILTPTITFGAGSGSINFNQVDTATMTNRISGSGSVNQLGSGTTILTASNNYTGTTTVSAGTLLANNSSGSAVGTSTVNVSGGTLGGTGIIMGATTIANGGTLAAGSDGTGGLSFTGGLTLKDGATTSFTIHSANDFTSIYLVGNTVIYGGALDFNVASYNPVVGDLFKVFNMIGGATESGDFSSVKVGNIYLSDSSGIWSGISAGATYQFNDVTGELSVGSVDSIPEPSTWALLGLGAFTLAIVIRRRRI
jgi:T5SS/PEP-CTERM-associated repeat protein/autotransporter-associated beta strand protein